MGNSQEPRCAICGRPAWGYNKAIDENEPAEKVKFEEIYIPLNEFHSEEELKRQLESSGAGFSGIERASDKWVVKNFEGYLCLKHWPKCAICGRPAWGPRARRKLFKGLFHLEKEFTEVEGYFCIFHHPSEEKEEEFWRVFWENWKRERSEGNPFGLIEEDKIGVNNKKIITLSI